MTSYPDYGRIDGPIVMIGFGSIGRGTLPLIERHFEYDQKQFFVVEPSDEHHTFLVQRGITHVQQAVTRENYRELLGGLWSRGAALSSTSRSIPARST
jgi:homospermidine synthase